MLQTSTIIGTLALCAMALTSCGPQMDKQPSIQPYSRQMPQMPSGIVPTTGSIHSVLIKQSKLSSNPLPATRRNLANGRIYYGYYCLMCHGENGDGNGPVGIAYVPKAADLGSPAVKGLSDGDIYRKMLTGKGHSPVLEETVLASQRWPLVIYVRTFK